MAGFLFWLDHDGRAINILKEQEINPALYILCDNKKKAPIKDAFQVQISLLLPTK